jgi:enhancing lycopene biosynthesis protein 2
MNKKVAVIFSGCGVYDGAEIYESDRCCGFDQMRRYRTASAPQ